MSQLYDAQEIKNEIHFVCRCDLYEYMRDNMFRKVIKRYDVYS